MELSVIIVNDFQLLTAITKSSILDVAAVLDPPLEILCTSPAAITCSKSAIETLEQEVK